MTDKKAVKMILKELKQARAKHKNSPVEVLHRAAIVAEESGELVRAALQWHYEGGGYSDCETEAVQTAVTCIRFLTRK